MAQIKVSFTLNELLVIQLILNDADSSEVREKIIDKLNIVQCLAQKNRDQPIDVILNADQQMIEWANFYHSNITQVLSDRF